LKEFDEFFLFYSWSKRFGEMEREAEGDAVDRVEFDGGGCVGE